MSADPTKAAPSREALLAVHQFPGEFVIKAFGKGVAAPSANRFGSVSATTATHVVQDLGDAVDYILDGGPCQVGVESTIVDVSPFSTNGALVLASAQGVDRDVFFRKLLTYGGIVTLVAPVVVWLLFVVL